MKKMLTATLVLASLSLSAYAETAPVSSNQPAAQEAVKANDAATIKKAKHAKHSPRKTEVAPVTK